MGSDGHRANILNPAYSVMGLGYVTSVAGGASSSVDDTAHARLDGSSRVLAHTVREWYDQLGFHQEAVTQ